MILVDTSVWIEHLRAADARLVELLGDDEAGCHPLVIEELALGSIKQRDVVLDLLANLYQFPVVTHDEVLRLVGRRRLWGRDSVPSMPTFLVRWLWLAARDYGRGTSG